MKKMKLIYVRNSREFSQGLWEELISVVPENLRLKINRFRFWKDRQFSLLGKLLLNTIIQDSFKGKTLSDIKFSKYNKPYLEEAFSFNISHSGDFILFAYMFDNESLGVDIEIIDSTIELKIFDSVLRTDEKKEINESLTPIHDFYKIWTIKEAVIKADGRGLNIPLEEIIINTNFVKIGEKLWYQKQVFIEKQYKSHIVTSIKDFKIDLEEFTIEDLYNKTKGKQLMQI